MWCECSSGRMHNGMGLTPLSWVDIQAWVSLTQEVLTPVEIRVIKKIDRWWSETVQAEKPKDG